MGGRGSSSGISARGGQIGGINQKDIAKQRQNQESKLSRVEAYLANGGIISDYDAKDILKQEYVQERFLNSIKKGGKPDGLGKIDRQTILASETLMPRYMKLLSGMKKSQINKLRREARIDVENRLKKK